MSLLTINAIQDAIDRADRMESKLTAAPLAIGGYTSPRIRHLLNNLGAISNNYLEVGVHRGATFVAATYKNRLATTTAIDNFTEFDDGTVKNEFLQNIERFVESPKMLFNVDCWTLKPDFHNPIDLYLFDGAHDIESQRDAVVHFLPAMTDEFVMCVDDYDWPDVSYGTERGLYESDVEVIQKWILPGGEDKRYWNGFAVFYLRKPKKS